MSNNTAKYFLTGNEELNDDCNPGTLDRKEMIAVGKAILSFRMDECDQAIHILLPTTDGGNALFTDLYEKYFNLIPHSDKMTKGQKYILADWELEDGGNDQYCNIHVGAIAQWFEDWGIEIGDMERSYMKLFRDIVATNEPKELEDTASRAHFNEDKEIAYVNEYALHDIVARLNSTRFLEEVGIVLESQLGAPKIVLEPNDDASFDRVAMAKLVKKLNRTLRTLGVIDAEFHDLAEYTC